MTVEQAVPPGELADLSTVLGHLEGLDDHDLAAELTAAETLLRAAQARRAAVVASVHDRVEALGYRMSGVTDTVAAITVTSTRSAGYLVDTSLGICERPAVWAALATGTIDARRAQHISDALAEVPEPDRTDLETRALAYATSHTAYQTRQHLTRLLVDYQPDLAADEQAKQKAKAWDNRHIAVFAREHGMADVYAYLPAGTAQVLITALDELARTYHDERSMDQKRVDALAQILAENTHLDIHVDVVIPADTLTGLQDTGASIDGYGPVDADHARVLALDEDARWQRLITEPATGRLIDLSTTAYRIPDHLKRAVRARDRRCRFPTCSVPARRTDTDHIIPWPTGPTAEPNLDPGCRGHHRIKTHSTWTCETNPDGSITWTSPLGTTHLSWPWNYTNPDH